MWSAIGRLTAVVLLLVLNGCLTRSLSGEDYGRYALIESLVLLVSLVAMGGLPIVGMRLLLKASVSDDASAGKRVVGCCLLIAGMTAVSAGLATWLFAWMSRSHVLPGTFWPFVWPIILWGVCTAFLRLVSELCRGYQRFAISSFIGGQRGGFGANGLVLLLAVVVSKSAGMTLDRILAIQIGVQFFFLCLGCFVLFRDAGLASIPRQTDSSGDRSATFWDLVSRSWPLMVTQLVAFGLPEFDTLLIGSMMGAEEAAIYRPARLLTIVVSVPLLLINNATQPFLAELHALGDKQRLAALVRGSATMAALPSLVLLAGFIFIPERILSAAFGEQYVSAATALRVLACGSAVFVWTGSCGMVLQMTGHEKSAMARSLLCAAFYLVAAPWLVSQYGILGAAIAASVLQITNNILTTLLVYRYEKIWTTATFSRQMLVDYFRIIFPQRLAAGPT